eukprot:2462333-Prymnesium_polylepis.12
MQCQHWRRGPGSRVQKTTARRPWKSGSRSQRTRSRLLRNGTKGVALWRHRKASGGVKDHGNVVHVGCTNLRASSQSRRS